MTNAQASGKTEKFGRYLLERRIAIGGMAEIFLARQTGQARFDKEVVIKRILPQYADHKDFVTMFLDEAALAARLNHPNIVQIFDVGREGQNYYLAMEYICGCDMQLLVRKNRKLERKVPLALAVRIIADACAGLHFAHEMSGADGEPLDIVHRDVSPQNVLISFDGAVKIADFGIAKAQSQLFKTRSGVLKGKYSYMSPEQAKGGELDRRSDIFSLGILLYELTTGARLYKESSELMTLKSIVEGKVVPPRELDPEFPEALEKILLHALHKEPAERYQDARELQGDLERFLVEEGLAGHHLALASHMEEVFEGRRPEPGLHGEGSSVSGPSDSDWSISTLSGDDSSLSDKVAVLDHVKSSTAPGARSASGARSAPRPVRKTTDGGAGSHPKRRKSDFEPSKPSPADTKLKVAVALLVVLVVGLLMAVLLLLVMPSESESLAPPLGGKASVTEKTPVP